MVCPACPAVGVLGGWLGGFIGINPPKRTGVRVFSAVVTASMIGITVVAMKYFFGFSICDGNGNFSLRNIAQVSVISLLMGLVYSVVVNLLFNRYIFAEAKPQPPSPADVSQPPAPANKPCCCHV